MQRGDTVAGRFEIEMEANSGGMGTVYRAWDRAAELPVAVKLLRDSRLENVERFTREALLLERMTHPGIVRYIAQGTTLGGEHYLVMEWVEGESLAQRLDRVGLTAVEAVEVVRRAAEALGEAHGRGVIHRDIKPSNVMFALASGETPERVKVIDFGIARPIHSGGASGLTRTGMMVGTPGYMAPEQALGAREVDARADVFALGCVLYECLTGCAAFAGEHPMAVRAKVLLTEPPLLAELCEEATSELAALVGRMLAKEPDGRPRDAAEVGAELASLPPLLQPRRRRAWKPSTRTSVTTGIVDGGAAMTTFTQWPRVRPVYLVLASAPEDEVDASTAPAPAALRERLAGFGARVDHLADGSVIARLGAAAIGEAPGAAAARAARCALAMRASLPDAPMVLATADMGHATQILIDAAVRALALQALHDQLPTAARPPRGAIWLDEAVAGALDEDFEILRGDPSGSYLLGARAGAATPSTG